MNYQSIIQSFPLRLQSDIKFISLQNITIAGRWTSRRVRSGWCRVRSRGRQWFLHFLHLNSIRMKIVWVFQRSLNSLVLEMTQNYLIICFLFVLYLDDSPSLKTYRLKMMHARKKTLNQWKDNIWIGVYVFIGKLQLIFISHSNLDSRLW